MNLSTLLPRQAFLPQRNLSEQERRAFVEKRDQIYSLCTPDEQQCLVKLACLYESHCHQLMGQPNIFTQSNLAVFYHQHFPWQSQEKPNAIVRGLAQVSRLINKAERWHGKRSQATFISHICSLVDEGLEDVLLGVAVFCCVLPVEIGALYGRGAFEEQLKILANKCIASNRVSALRRFEAAHRCIRWQPQSRYSFELRAHLWRLLLGVAHEDMTSALALINEHWNQTRSPQILITGRLHEMPELAYQLAVKLKPQHISFATDMLGESILGAWLQLSNVEQSSAILLEKLMDASCRLLAEWTFESMRTDFGNPLGSMDRLFRFGNPEDEYWRKIPRECLAEIKNLPSIEQDRQLRLLAQVVYYGSNSSSLVDEAHELFQACMTRKLDAAQERTQDWTKVVSDICKSLSILEEKALSFRNRRVAASPDHFLLTSVERQIHSFFEHLLAHEPAAALQNTVALVHALSNQNLIRKYHQILRIEFEGRARNFPAEAGNALKRLIQYCGYSQVDDEMYRKELCEESFQALILILECISPCDAAIARTGIGWSPRGDV